MTEYLPVTADMSVYRDGTIKLHGPEGFEGMRKAGRLAAEILDELTTLVRPGVSTEDIDRVVREMTLDGGAVTRTRAASRSTTWSATASLRRRR